MNLSDPWPQRGQYFGASLAVVDLNNDGMVDLVVGSPLFIEYKSGSTESKRAVEKEKVPTSVYTGKSHKVAFEVKEEKKASYEIGKITVFIRSGSVGMIFSFDCGQFPILEIVQGANPDPRNWTVGSIRLCNFSSG